MLYKRKLVYKNLLNQSTYSESAKKKFHANILKFPQKDHGGKTFGPKKVSTVFAKKIEYKEVEILSFKAIELKDFSVGFLVYRLSGIILRKKEKETLSQRRKG